jgi:hypothetical protein
MNFRVPASRLAAAALVVLLGGCASTSESAGRAEVTEEQAAEASVVEVLQAARAVTLQRADGQRLTVTCGPEVRNFDRINVGDKVKALYRMTLAVRVLRPDEPDTMPSSQAAVARAAVGAEPGAGVAAGLAMTVKVESVDAEKHVVVFTDPDGRRRTVRAQRDEGKRFVEGLKPGDRVEIVHREGVALSVE